MGPFSFGAKLKVNCGAAIVIKLGFRLKLSKSSSGVPSLQIHQIQEAIQPGRPLTVCSKGKWEKLNSHLVGSCHLFPGDN